MVCLVVLMMVDDRIVLFCHQVLDHLLRLLVFNVFYFDARLMVLVGNHTLFGVPQVLMIVIIGRRRVAFLVRSSGLRLLDWSCSSSSRI